MSSIFMHSYTGSKHEYKVLILEPYCSKVVKVTLLAVGTVVPIGEIAHTFLSFVGKHKTFLGKNQQQISDPFGLSFKRYFRPIKLGVFLR
jgi:hypothetical protein